MANDNHPKVSLSGEIACSAFEHEERSCPLRTGPGVPAQDGRAGGSGSRRSDCSAASTGSHRHAAQVTGHVTTELCVAVSGYR
jgi:hypothetical protein